MNSLNQQKPNRNHDVHFTCTEQEIQQLLDAAQADNRTLTSYCRNASLLKASSDETKQTS